MVLTTTTGTLAIKAGRHPILENIQSAATLVPNDVFASEASAFQIIQGPVSYRCLRMLADSHLCRSPLQYFESIRTDSIQSYYSMSGVSSSV